MQFHKVFCPYVRSTPPPPGSNNIFFIPGISPEMHLVSTQLPVLFHDLGFLQSDFSFLHNAPRSLSSPHWQSLRSIFLLTVCSRPPILFYHVPQCFSSICPLFHSKATPNFQVVCYMSIPSSGIKFCISIVLLLYKLPPTQCLELYKLSYSSTNQKSDMDLTGLNKDVSRPAFLSRHIRVNLSPGLFQNFERLSASFGSQPFSIFQDNNRLSPSHFTFLSLLCLFSLTQSRKVSTVKDSWNQIEPTLIMQKDNILSKVQPYSYLQIPLLSCKVT